MELPGFQRGTEINNLSFQISIPTGKLFSGMNRPVLRAYSLWCGVGNWKSKIFQLNISSNTYVDETNRHAIKKRKIPISITEKIRFDLNYHFEIFYVPIFFFVNWNRLWAWENTELVRDNVYIISISYQYFKENIESEAMHAHAHLEIIKA